MSDELDILKSVAAHLEAAGISYMVAGSMATNFYATPRMTCDIDMVVELEEADVKRVATLFQDEYYIDQEMVRQAVINRSMFNMIHNTMVVKVDCVVRVRNLLRSAENLDHAYLNGWADRLGLAELYREVQHHA